ncbi:MAG: hypothetical protein P9M03_09615 [Candidatus Theseobacter exili]|nr:hypothetical protein [Candidatus Theseobacter exili]
MHKVATALKQEFMSSSGLTEQFSDFYKLFKRELTITLKKHFNIAEIRISRGHFYVSGFFQLTDGRIWYFSLGDVRWGDGKLLIRRAKSFQDYTGGSNNFVDVADIAGLKRVVS